MAMLAEPRQKKRYHLTPKGKPLFEDSDRFGTKMLEKMGWSKGKGLGKSENGTQDFVRVKYKSDDKGLGFQDRDDQWTEHDKNFNGLLDNLNGNDTTNRCPDDCEIVTPTVGLGFASKSSSNKKKLKDKISGQSLEEKSKKSKARVHYQKFTKGKDMSQYSEKDLANIFGKKATPDDTNIYNQFQAFNAAGSNENDSDKKEEKEVEAPVKVLPPIVNTGVSVNDYFKTKMAALKAKNGGDSANPFNNNIRIINNVEVFVPSAKRKRSTDTEVSEAEEEKVPPKKKKSKTIKVDVESESVNQAAAAAVKGESEETKEDDIPKKKKKNKKQSIDENEKSDSETKTKETNEEVVRKEKKKNKKNTQIDADDETNQNPPLDSNSEESSSSKKKKKSKKVPEENIRNEECIEMSCIPADDEIPKKKKKKDKQKTAEVNDSEHQPENPSYNQEKTIEESKTQQNIEETSIPMEEETITIKSKTKSNKKKKNKTIQAEVEVSSHQKNEELTSSLTIMNENNNFLIDTYTISTFCAEKFRILEIHQFEGSNLMDINGYGLSKNLQLDIQTISTDSERIMRLWRGTLDKYTHSSSKQKIYSSYLEKVKVARKKKVKIPSLKFKGLKRQHVFQCL